MWSQVSSTSIERWLADAPGVMQQTNRGSRAARGACVNNPR